MQTALTLLDKQPVAKLSILRNSQVFGAPYMFIPFAVHYQANKWLTDSYGCQQSDIWPDRPVFGGRSRWQFTVAHKCQRPENPQHNSFKLLCCGFLGNTTKWNCCVVDVPTTQRKLRRPRSANVQKTHNRTTQNCCAVIDPQVLTSRKPTTEQLKTVVLWVFWTLALVGHRNKYTQNRTGESPRYSF